MTINFKQAEQLIVLMEECAEVQQAASKILRFGNDQDKIGALTQELGDLLGIIEWVTREFDIDPDTLIQYGELKQTKMKKWCSYNK